MKVLLLCIVIAVIIAVGYPPLNESATNTCSALELRLIMASSADKRDLPALLALGAVQRSVSDGAFATALVKQQSPNVPAAISCAVAYWQVLADARKAQAIIAGAPRSSRSSSEVIIQTASPAVETEKAMRALGTPSAPPNVPRSFDPAR